MDIFDLYKPFRNRIREFGMIDSLLVIRAWSQFHQFDQPLPASVERPRMPLTLANQAQPWELELFAKEFILNAGVRGRRSLRKWDAFAEIVNRLRVLENKIYGSTPAADRDVLLEMFRIAHRQFHWQRKPNTAAFIRCYKVFSAPELDSLLNRQLGLDAREVYTIGLALTAHFLKEAVYRPSARPDLPPITAEQVARFVRHFSSSIHALQREIAQSQSYTEDFVYAYNPLRRWPMLRDNYQGEELVLAPIPTLLFRRFTEGIYYELCNVPGFGNAFGASFQRYVGEVFDKTLPASWPALPEAEYDDGKNHKHSIDWIVRSETADIFVECKTKRLRLASKANFTSRDALDSDIEKMSEFVVQIYKAIRDANLGLYPHWKPRGGRIYPIILTFEEWFLFSPQVTEALESAVRRRFAAEGLDSVYSNGTRI